MVGRANIRLRERAGNLACLPSAGKAAVDTAAVDSAFTAYRLFRSFCLYRLYRLGNILPALSGLTWTPTRALRPEVFRSRQYDLIGHHDVRHGDAGGEGDDGLGPEIVGRTSTSSRPMLPYRIPIFSPYLSA